MTTSRTTETSAALGRIAVFAALIVVLGTVIVPLPGGVPITAQTLGSCSPVSCWDRASHRSPSYSCWRSPRWGFRCSRVAAEGSACSSAPAPGTSSAGSPVSW